MRLTDKISVLVNLVASVAIIVSLVLISMQLRQAADLAHREERSSYVFMMEQIEAMVIGENMAEVLARVEAGGTQVRDSDRIQFAYFANNLLTYWKVAPEVIESGMNQSVCYYFGHQVGRAYLAYINDGWTNERDSDLEKIRAMADNCDDTIDYLEFSKTYN